MAKRLTKLCKSRTNFIEKMEKIYFRKIKEKELADDNVIESIVYAKVKQSFHEK